jgi:hypothetical protein
LIAYADAAGISGENSRAQYAVTYNLIQSRDGDTKDYEEELSRKTGKINTRSIIATSTDLAQSESEVGAMVEATKDTIFFRNLMQDLHQTQWKATPLYNDSKPAIILTIKYSGNHKRVRYCLKNINWCLEKVKQSVVEY